MGKLKLKHLTPEQYEFYKKNIFNGVGTSFAGINPPDFKFEEAALYHDLAYWVGGNELDRLQADFIFFYIGVKCIFKSPWYMWLGLSIILPIYSLFVLLFGWISFEYGKPSKNWEELLDKYNKSKTN
jgi:hypothetical protein